MRIVLLSFGGGGGWITPGGLLFVLFVILSPIILPITLTIFFIVSHKIELSQTHARHIAWVLHVGNAFILLNAFNIYNQGVVKENEVHGYSFFITLLILVIFLKLITIFKNQKLQYSASPVLFSIITILSVYLLNWPHINNGEFWLAWLLPASAIISLYMLAVSIFYKKLNPAK
ncbi:hypothetical protein COV82_06160 [Candidatus Peregrinibacteria bacterium CG11_big_fil_rev_8_21_14_0_20_46_8]|nr:MAG: hypothetical protein COV82_06160 [Candidatus Peregrinibacteria bacterium CG11_big_fil_rev_8_21_14_0_20_46_8]